ncbi:MAG TPA: biotin/lipoyl-binding protein, partial [Smithellaceae bacterium]|nr:biotin/lipoyl-binding protein [Smithellaceae bacterium]
MKTKGLVIGFVVLLIAAALFVFVGKANRQNGTLFYSGTIEATQVRLSFQVSGRVLKVHVEEGQRVENGRLLVEMEPDEFDARVSQAQANLDRARKVELQAKAALAVLEKTLPAEVARAEAGLRSARAVLRDAERNDQRYANLFDQDVVSEKDRDTVRLNYEMAKSRLAESESLLGLARGNLSRLEASRKDVDAARAQIAVAEAALTQARIQRTYAELRSPLAGVVTSR